MSSTTNTTITETFSNLSESLKALEAEGVAAKKRAEYFQSVDTVTLQLRGSIRVKEEETKGVFEFRTKTSEGWITAKAKCTEKKMRIFRWASVIGEGGEKIGEMLLACTVRSYVDKEGTIIGVSSKNTRFNKDVLTGKELVRAHGHINTWVHSYKGQEVTTQVFNANGLGLAAKPSEFKKAQEDALKNLPNTEDVPE